MSERSEQPFAIEVDKARRNRWTRALQRTHGNIARAARALSWSVRYGRRLTREFGLTAWARELRIARGNAATGRPRA